MLQRKTMERENKGHKNDRIITEVKKYWLDLISPGKAVDKEDATSGINWLYSLVGYDSPKIIFVESPLMSRIEIIELEKSYSVSKDSIKPIYNLIQERLLKLVCTKDDYLPSTSWIDDIRNEVQNRIYNPILGNVEFSICADRGSLIQEFGITLFPKMAMWDFNVRVGNLINIKEFNQLKSTLASGLYEAVFLKHFCFVSSMPRIIHKDFVGRMHAENSASVLFGDGYKLFSWHGVSVPKKWIEEKETINWEVILRETNAERRRCLREILGVEKYFKLQGGVHLVDVDLDDHGNEMKLYVSKRKDSFINQKVQFLEVVCPSTKRNYILYPPNQKSRNVWDAKASTFRNEKIEIRHGDVGLLNLEHEYEKPKKES